MKHYQKPNSLSESGILAVFDALGLTTQEQRDRILALTKVMDLDTLPKSHAVTWLSNNSEPVSSREESRAG